MKIVDRKVYIKKDLKIFLILNILFSIENIYEKTISNLDFILFFFQIIDFFLENTSFKSPFSVNNVFLMLNFI